MSAADIAFFSSFQNCVQRVKKGGHPLHLLQIAVENELDFAFSRPTRFHTTILGNLTNLLKGGTGEVFVEGETIFPPPL